MEPDADQRRWGELEAQARHYGRTRDGFTEVCTIDLWRFATPAQSAAAARGIPQSNPKSGWHFEARGTLLVSLHGTRWQPGQSFEEGLFPACHELAKLIRD